MSVPSPYVRGVHLSRTDENVAEIEALRNLLGGAPGLAGLVDDLKYPARRALLPKVLGRAVEHAFAWDLYDTRDRRWWPQGISTSADADESERKHGRALLVATWYAKDLGHGGHGSRVTFLDLESLRYRHVLLVVPRLDREGQVVLAPLHVHAGGIVWAGDHLHIAATSRGFVSARVEDIMRVSGDDERPDKIGVVDGRVASFGHRYVLPVRFRWQAHADEGHQRLRYSFLSLDRRSDPPALVAGEYARRRGQTSRLARYALDPGTWLPSTGEDGFSRPLSLAEDGPARMQGAVVAGDRHYLSVSQGPWRSGSVYAGRPGDFTHHRFAVPMGPEDLAWWPSTDLLWTVTEHPWRRWIVAMKRSWFG